VCNGAAAFTKDFNPSLDLIVAIGAAISAGFYWFRRGLIAYSFAALR
jgi:hypothetical protein